MIPFGGTGHDLLDTTGTLPHGTPEARLGLSVGMIVGGLFTMWTGANGEVAGGAASVTGVGAAAGVPVMVVSTTMVVGGAANVLAGLRGLSQSMMSAGSGSGGGAVKPDGTKLSSSEISAPPAKRGDAPRGKDGHPIELHHRDQTPDSPLDEMSRRDHRGAGNFSKNHSNTGQEPSKIDRKAWKQEQKEYWRKEWDDGRFEDP